MKLVQPVKIGAWFLILMNLLMAFGCIWVFLRMAPAIEIIIAQNEVSLEACEEMLAALLDAGTMDDVGKGASDVFRAALEKAQNNITEDEEPATLQKIAEHFTAALNGNPSALTRTVEAIVELGDINRDAMYRADTRARQLGYAGAWAVVSMATLSFLIGMIFLRTMKKNLVDPIQEIDAAISAFLDGDQVRRCSIKSPSREIRKIFGNVNQLLDMNSTYNPRTN